MEGMFYPLSIPPGVFNPVVATSAPWLSLTPSKLVWRTTALCEADVMTVEPNFEIENCHANSSTHLQRKSLLSSLTMGT
jgi:hypothetical protein